MGLSVKKIERLQERGRYRDNNGLYLQITEDGVRSWVFRYELNKQRRWMGLGPLHTVDLNEARERARKARQQLLDGIDPIAARKADLAAKALEAAKALTFEKDEAMNAMNDPHWQNFIECIKSRAKPMSDIETCVRSSTACILANLAMRHKTCLDWDESAWTVNQNHIRPYLKAKYRSPWKLEV